MREQTYFCVAMKVEAVERYCQQKYAKKEKMQKLTNRTDQ